MSLSRVVDALRVKWTNNERSVYTWALVAHSALLFLSLAGTRTHELPPGIYIYMYTQREIGICVQCSARNAWPPLLFTRNFTLYVRFTLCSVYVCVYSNSLSEASRAIIAMMQNKRARLLSCAAFFDCSLLHIILSTWRCYYLVKLFTLSLKLSSSLSIYIYNVTLRLRNSHSTRISRTHDIIINRLPRDESLFNILQQSTLTRMKE